jgi:hypothetical protein
VFRDFDAGTFTGERGGNRLEVWNDAKSVEVDSLLDLQELVKSSSKISAETAGDTLILRVAQEEEVAEITLEGLGHEFQAAHHGELF